MTTLTENAHVRDLGNGAPLLLIHAFPLSGAMWQPQIEALAHNYRLIVPDLPGFGKTPLTADAYSLDDMADWLVSLLDERGLDRVAVAGLSMGGYVAFALLRRHRERITALVLADTRAGADSAEGKAGRETNAQLAENEGASAIANKMLPSLLSPDASAAATATLRAIIEGNAPAGIAAALRAMARRADSTELLADISVPTLIIVGAQDALTPPSEAQAMHSAIVGSQLVELANAGHIANIEQPEAFTTALQGFLNSM